MTQEHGTNPICRSLARNACAHIPPIDHASGGKTPGQCRKLGRSPDCRPDTEKIDHRAPSHASVSFHMPLHDLPQETRPREKLLARGAAALSDAELLALLLLSLIHI